MSIEIHNKIKKKLDLFIKEKTIPHIIFNGPSGSGKKYIMNHFIENIYKTPEKIKKYTMFINCAHNKGIRFIRDELKFFAKTNIYVGNGNIFKSIILFNADKLTTDAQSALRRCIEQFSHTTRFFIVLENQNALLKPILSRFCNIYIPLPLILNEKRSLYDFKRQKYTKKYISLIEKKNKWLTKQFTNNKNYSNISKCFNFSIKLYEKGYSALDILDYIYQNYNESAKKFSLLIYFHKIKKEFRNEVLLIMLIINITYMRSEVSLENIEEM